MTSELSLRANLPFIKYVAEQKNYSATNPQEPKRSIFERIDDGIGLTWLKKNVKKYTGITYLSNKITEAVDDGDDNNLSIKERLWEGVKGAGKAVENFIGSQGLAFMGMLALGSYAATLAGIGKAFSIITKSYFLLQGTRLAVKGTKDFVKADTKEEARDGATTAATGGIMLYGTVKGIAKDVKAYNTAKANFRANVESSRATLGIEDGEVLTEATLKSAYRQAAKKNHPDKGGSEAAMAEVTAAFEFLTKNMKSASKIRTSAVPAPTADAPAVASSSQLVPNSTGEMGLVLANHYNNTTTPLIIPLNPIQNQFAQTGAGEVVSIEAGVEVPTTVEGMRAAIENATDIGALRSLRGGMRNMPSDVKSLYVQREQFLREDLPPTQKSMVAELKASAREKRAEAAKETNANEKAAKKAGKLERLVSELEQKGFTDIQETQNRTLKFKHHGVEYELSCDSQSNVNLYKLLKKVSNNDIVPTELKIKANGKYDVDWKFGKDAIVTKNLLMLLESNEILTEEPYFKNIIEAYTRYMTFEELDEFSIQHRNISLKTKMGNRYVERTKIANPARYIEIMTPEELFKTAAGKRYLKINAPEKYAELKAIDKMITAIENAANIDELRSLSVEMKKMPLYVKEIYNQKAMALRENLLPEQKSVVNSFLNSSESSDRAKFVKYLDSSYSKGGVTVKMEGETAQTKYIKYLDSQEGSNSGFWVQHPENGKLYYIKFAPWEEKNGHIQAEIEASKLYNLAGIKTPTIISCVVGGKYRALASEYVPNMKSISKPEEVHIGFAADAWLANWDSTIDENTRIVNGEPLKLDNGGSLNYRAMGMKKESFDTTVDELVSLVDGTNSASQEIYSSISYETLVKSFEKVCSISDKAIFETVQDKAIAIILIKRRNYMSSVLENIKKTPYNGNNIAEYMKNVTQNLTKSTYNSYRISDDVLAKYQQEVDTKNKIAPSTTRIHKILLSVVKEREKEGIVISREELIEYFEKQIIQELPAKGLDGFQAKAHRENSKHIFITLKNIAEKTPIKDGEKISSYLNRIIKLSEKRQKQLDNLRIKTIKDLLKYEEQDEIKEYTLTKEDKRAIIKDINDRIYTQEYSKGLMLSENTLPAEILKTATMLMLGGPVFVTPKTDAIFKNMLERYNSSAKPTNCIMDEIFTTDKSAAVPTDYTTDFKYEPVYRWLSFDDPDAYIKSLPKNGGIVESQGASCSMNKFYAESEFNDSNPNMNVKLIIHPKSQISHARILGHNYEVLYKGTQKFVVLHKELIEYTDPESKLSCFRWEVHLQEY